MKIVFTATEKLLLGAIEQHPGSVADDFRKVEGIEPGYGFALTKLRKMGVIEFITPVLPRNNRYKLTAMRIALRS
jgi:hypothetical protein